MANSIDRITDLGTEGPLVFVKGYEKKVLLDIQKLLRFLRPQLEEGVGSVNYNQLYKGKLLACKPNATSETWYRCKVERTDNFVHKKLIEVSLADFNGSCMSLSINLLRDLGFFNLATLTQPPQNITVYLQGIIARRGWIAQTIERLKVSFTAKDPRLVEVQVAFRCKNKDFAHIMIDGVNMAEILFKEGSGGEIVSRTEQVKMAELFWTEKDLDRESTLDLGNFASPSPDFEKYQTAKLNSFKKSKDIPDESTKPPATQPSQNVKSVEVNIPGYNATGIPAQNYIYGIPQTVPPTQVVQMMSAYTIAGQHMRDVRTAGLLAANSSHFVTISHVENGAQAFYVHLKSNQQMVQEVNNRLKQLQLSPPSILQEGMACALQKNDCVFRCVVMSVDPCKVRLVDTGISLKVKYTEIYELPAQFAAMGQLAYRFCLAGVHNNTMLFNNSDAIEKFKSIAKNTEQFVLKVTKPDGPPTVQYCELYHNSRNVLEMLTEEASKPLEYEMKSLQNNETHEVVVSFVDSGPMNKLPWTFYVQMKSEIIRLDNCTSLLQKYCEKAPVPDMSEIKEKTPIFAKYSVDDRWYRGMIVKLKEEMATVFFVDYGNTEEVPMRDLKLATRSIVGGMPAQAIKCLLDGVSSKESAKQIMEDKSADKTFVLTVVYKLECNTANVRLIEKGSTNEVYLNDILMIESMQTKPPSVLNLPDVANPVQTTKSNLKILNVSELNHGNSNAGVNHEQRRPDRPIYSIPKDRLVCVPTGCERRMDWDHPSNNYFADKKNPDYANSHCQREVSTIPEKNTHMNRSFDEPDRINLKRGSDSIDNWSSKRPNQSPRIIVGSSYISHSKSINQETFTNPVGYQNLFNTQNSSGNDNRDANSSCPNQRSVSSERNNFQSQDRLLNQRSASNDRKSFHNQDGPQKFNLSQEESGAFGKQGSFGNNRNGGANKSPSFNSGGNQEQSRSNSQRGNYGYNQNNKQEHRSNDSQNFGSAGRNNRAFLGEPKPNWETKQPMAQEKNSTERYTIKETSNSFGGSRTSMNCQVTSADNWDIGVAETPSKKETIKIPELTIKIGEQLSALMVYFKTPMDFFVQPLANSTTIETLTASVSTSLDEGSSQEVFEGDFCWAKYPADNAWYRATVQEKLEDKCKVLFVDYGNTSMVPNSDTRPIKNEHAVLPAQSFNCSLRGLEKTEWSEDELSKFEKEASDAELKVTVVAKLKDKFSVILCKEEECINIAMGALAESLLPIKNLPSQILPVDTTHTNMTISWFVNPNSFSLHKVKSCENLKDLIDISEDKLPRLPLWEPKIGTFVHIEVNKKLLRGAIVAVRENKCKVELLDYGRVMISAMDVLNALPEEFLSTPKQAISCGLYEVKPKEGQNWPKIGTNGLFDSIFNGSKTFTVNVKSTLADGRLEVEMIRDDGVNVVELLQKHGFTASPVITVSVPTTKSVEVSAEKAVPQAKWKVYTSFFENIFKFYVHKVADQIKIESLLDKLQTVESMTLSDVEVGQQVLAKSPDDSMWYRGSVIKKQPVEVFLLDYGNRFSEIELRELPEEFAAIPPYAICCCVPMTAVPESFTELQSKIENDLFDNEGLTMIILAVANDYLVVDFQIEQTTLIAKYFDEGLGIRKMFEGYVSNVMSLEAIDAQKVEDCDKLANMAKALEEAASFPVQEAKLSEHCVANFEDDGLFYRAQITTVEDKIEVCFYDYGNTATVTDIRKIPDDLLKVPQLSQLVTMKNAPESPAIREKILDMLSDGSIKFEFLVLCATSFPLEVAIFKDGIDVRKLASPGMNILATEFTPSEFAKPPLDLLNIAEDMIGQQMVLSSAGVEANLEMADGNNICANPAESVPEVNDDPVGAAGDKQSVSSSSENTKSEVKSDEKIGYEDCKIADIPEIKPSPSLDLEMCEEQNQTKNGEEVLESSTPANAETVHQSLDTDLAMDSSHTSLPVNGLDECNSTSKEVSEQEVVADTVTEIQEESAQMPLDVEMCDEGNKVQIDVMEPGSPSEKLPANANQELESDLAMESSLTAQVKEESAPKPLDVEMCDEGNRILVDATEPGSPIEKSLANANQEFESDLAMESSLTAQVKEESAPPDVEMCDKGYVVDTVMEPGKPNEQILANANQGLDLDLVVESSLTAPLLETQNDPAEEGIKSKPVLPEMLANETPGHGAESNLEERNEFEEKTAASVHVTISDNDNSAIVEENLESLPSADKVLLQDEQENTDCALETSQIDTLAESSDCHTHSTINADKAATVQSLEETEKINGKTCQGEEANEALECDPGSESGSEPVNLLEETAVFATELVPTSPLSKDTTFQETVTETALVEDEKSPNAGQQSLIEVVKHEEVDDKVAINLEVTKIDTASHPKQAVETVDPNIVDLDNLGSCSDSKEEETKAALVKEAPLPDFVQNVEPTNTPTTRELLNKLLDLETSERTACEGLLSIVNSAEEQSDTEGIKVEYRAISPTDELIFKKPLPVEHMEQNDETSSLHGSDMSIDELCSSEPTIFTFSVPHCIGKQNDEDNTQGRRILKRPLNFDQQELSIDENGTAKRANLESNETGDTNSSKDSVCT